MSFIISFLQPDGSLPQKKPSDRLVTSPQALPVDDSRATIKLDSRIHRMLAETFARAAVKLKQETNFKENGKDFTFRQLITREKISNQTYLRFFTLLAEAADEVFNEEFQNTPLTGDEIPPEALSFLDALEELEPNFDPKTSSPILEMWSPEVFRQAEERFIELTS